MERLTVKAESNCGFVWALKSPGTSSQEAIDRLATYENTGLGPEDIISALNTLDLFADATHGVPLNRIRELAQAEKDGRLVVLPCKPGAELFTHCHVRGANPIAHSYFYPPYIPTLGENAWLTREEAEAALRKAEPAHDG